MAKKDLRAGILTSMKAEEKATEERFERAESLFAAKEAKPSPAPVPAPSEGMMLQTFSVRRSDLDALDRIKARCVHASVAADRQDLTRAAMATNRSEIVRVAIEALGRLDDAQLLELLAETQSATPRRRRRLQS